MKKNLIMIIMTETEKNEVLAGYSQQFNALTRQCAFAVDMVEHYAYDVVHFNSDLLETPDFWSLGYAKELANICRQYVKFFDLYCRTDDDVKAISDEIAVIKTMK